MDPSANSSDLRRTASVRWSRFKTRWPFLIWLAAAGCFVMLIYRQGGTRTLSGVIEKQITEVCALETAVIKEVMVEPGQAVKQGDLLALLDTVLLDAEWTAAASAQKANARQMQGQFERARFQAAGDLNALRIDQAGDEAELAVLSTEVARLESLLSRRMIDEQAVSAVRARRDALQAAVDQYPAAIQQLEEYITWARSEKDALAVDMAPATAEALELRRRPYRLTALHDGVVSQVMRHAGEVVDVREVVLTLARKHSNRIIALLPEARATAVQPGQRYLVQSQMAPRGKSVPAVIVALSPEIIGLPQQSVLVPGRIIRGRRVALDLQGDHPFLPGEAVNVRSQRVLRPGFLDEEETASDVR